MSGRNDKREGEEEGWESTFLKVAGAAAAAATVAGGLYALFKQPEPEAAQAFTGTVTGRAQMAHRPNKEVWTKPRPGWLKLNVDGSLLPLSAGCGGVLRDSSGKWISGFAVKLEPRSHYPDETEKEAIFRGLQWARGRRVRKVVVESDNRGIVDLVKSGSITINPLICKIRDLLSCGDWEATLNWIPGDANRVADKLADIARECDYPTFQLREFDSPPDGCRDALMADGKMSERDEENEEGGGSTFLKVASAAAAAATVAGGLYALLKQPEHEPEPYKAAHIFEGGGLLLERQSNEKEVLKVLWTKPKMGKQGGRAQIAQWPNKEVWTKPRPGWLKLNVDGSLQSESAGCGGVLRDSSGKWISGFAVKLAQPSGGHYPHKPEKEAICRGLQWAWERGENRVEVESDNKGLVDFVTSGRRTSDHVICEIRDLLYNRDWEATLNWIPGAANREADKLADIARGLPSFQLREFDTPP